MRNDNTCGSSGIILSFLVGGLFGAGLAMLLSPMSGPETRRRIADLTDDLSEKTDDLRDEARHRFSDVVQRGKDFIDDKKDVLANAIEAGKSAYLKEKEEGSSDDV